MRAHALFESGGNGSGAAGELIANAVYNVQVVRFSEIASSVVIIYEHAITLDREIDLIWNSPWSLGKALFLVNRYYTLLSVIFNNYVLFSNSLTPKLCNVWLYWQGYTGLFACMLAQTILQLRLYALYHLDKRVLACMVSMFVATSAVSAAIMGYVLSNATVTPLRLPGTAMSSCAVSDLSPYFWTFWAPILTCESVLCAMALVRGLREYWHRDRRTYYAGMRLVEILVRDSVLYFIVVFATYFTNAIVWIFGAESVVEIPIGFSVAMSCVMGNRLCLNVRRLVVGSGSHVIDSEFEHDPDDSGVDIVIPAPASPARSMEWSVRPQSRALTDVQLATLRGMRME